MDRLALTSYVKASLSKVVDHVKGYPVVYGTVAAVVAVLGGTMSITLPADVKVAQLEQRFAQTWQQQQQYHEEREVEAIDWRMRWVSQEINRINMIPQYLDRALTPEESWQIEQLKNEWALLQERRHQLVNQ